MFFRIYVLAVLSSVLGLTGAVEECQFFQALAGNLSQAHEELGKIATLSCNSTCSSINCIMQIGQVGIVPGGNLLFYFGLRLNSCDEPMSMSYYIDIPTVNMTMNGKITHDDEYSVPVPASIVPMSGAVKTTAVMKVEMVRVNFTHVKFGVNGIMKMSLDNPFIPAFSKSEPMIPPTIIDIMPCTNATDTSVFTNPNKGATLPTGKGTTPAPQKIIVNSATYNKSCEFGLIVNQCSMNEMCVYRGLRSRNGVCQCMQLHFLSLKTGYCESITSVTTAKDVLSVTQAMSKGGEHGEPSINKTGLIIGVGGGLLLIVVIVIIIVIIGRRRRLAMYRNRHALMTDDDDALDTNVVI